MKLFPYRAIYADLDLVASTDAFFSSAKIQYMDYVENGFYRDALNPSIYIYEISENGDSHLGLLACLDIDEYSQQNVLIHEYTLLDKEHQFMELLLERKAMIKPVLLSHTKSKDLQSVLRKYKNKLKPFIELNFEEEGTEHRYWRLENKDQVREVQEVFEQNVPRVYIADGHHRSRAIERLNQMTVKKKGGLRFDRLYCGLFGFDQLKVREFNRIISILNVVSPSLIMARLSAICEIYPLEKLSRPTSRREMTMLLKNEAYTLRWKPEVLENYKDELVLDPVLFNDLICRDICGIKDVRTDTRIKYMKGVYEIEEVERRTDYNEDVAFFLYPLDIEEFKYCSDNKIVLPPKTTYFTPRMKNGVIAQLF